MVLCVSETDFDLESMLDSFDETITQMGIFCAQGKAWVYLYWHHSELLQRIALNRKLWRHRSHMALTLYYNHHWQHAELHSYTPLGDRLRDFKQPPFTLYRPERQPPVYLRIAREPRTGSMERVPSSFDEKIKARYMKQDFTPQQVTDIHKRSFVAK